VTAVDCIVTRSEDGSDDSQRFVETSTTDGADCPLVTFDVDDAETAPLEEYDRLSRRVRRAVEQRDRVATDAEDDGTTGACAAPNVAQNRLQARYHAAFDRAKDAMVVTDEDGTHIDANDSAAALFGVPCEELLGRRVESFVPPDYDFDDEWLAFETDETANGTFPLLRPDGDQRLVEYAAVANIVPGEHLSVLRDVTERTRLQETLETEREALRELYRITADRDADFATKIQQLLVLGCGFLEVPFGFLTEIDEETQTIVDAHGDHPQLQAGETCPLSDAYCRKTITRDELVTVQNAVAEGWSDDPAYERFGLGCYAGAEITVEGETYGTLCFSGPEPRDEPFSDTERTFVELMSRWASYELEQRRATERLQAQNDRLEEFASMVSHDLRSPLNVARGFLDLARDSGDDDQFDRVEAAHDRIERLISDVLYLAREGQEIGTTEPVDLADAAQTSWNAVATDDSSGELHVAADVGTVDADQARLCQLLENLFRNAVEHGESTVAVTVEPTADGFAVADDGPGIPEREQDTVFERGFSTEDNGTGFGLYIVRKIAEAHGWTVSISDADDGGARFEFAGVEQAAE
jgi:PAS domain S-box-containing protein